jgi:hypothetical protein
MSTATIIEWKRSTLDSAYSPRQKDSKFGELGFDRSKMDDLEDFDKKIRSVIHPKAFEAEMHQHWETTLGNVSSPALRAVWNQLASAFGAHIIGFSTPETWTVLQPSTGSGKTQSAVMYCKMLADRLSKVQGIGELPLKSLCGSVGPTEELIGEHPGVLIVTRRIKEADILVEQINDLSPIDTAVAYHSESSVSINQLSKHPVLVVCHRAYENALNILCPQATIQETWPFLHDFNQGKRKLIIIDEALDIVEHSQAGIEGLRFTLGCIPTFVRDANQEAIKSLEELVSLLETYDRRLSASNNEDEAVKDHRELDKIFNEDKIPDLDKLRKDMKEIKFERQQHGKKDLAYRNKLYKTHDSRLREVHNTFKAWRYYSSISSEPTLHTARLIVPKDATGAVVLDATASSDLIYKLFDNAVIIDPPKGSRNYQNVTLHISEGHRVGKGYLTNNAKQVCDQLVAHLDKELSEDSRVLIVTHKDVEPSLLAYEKFTSGQWKACHWGALDGSNEWKDCDTAVIFGLPYMPDVWSANIFQALQGPQSTEWLQDAKLRKFGEYDDIREALKIGQMTTSIVQAINRIQCRKVTDSEGNCDETHIYIPMPNNYLGKKIIEGVVELMPGIKIENWEYDSTSKIAVRKARRGNYDASLIRFFENMGEGDRYSVSTVKKMLGIPNSTFDRMATKLKDSNHEMFKKIDSLDITFSSSGKGKPSYFSKKI